MTYEPGIHAHIPEGSYHQLPGLSSTGIKSLLDSPARFLHQRANRVEKKAFDLGHAVHAKVLGVGLDVVVIPDEILASNGATSTKAAKAFIEDARTEGQVPIKADEARQVNAAAEAVLDHPDAGPLFTGGAAEASLIWDDDLTGARCRGRLDYWHEAANVVVDLKTTARSANPRGIGRLAESLSWHLQAAHYRAGVEALTGTAPRFIHVVVEIDAPHLVSVIELDDDYLAIGAADVRHAIDTYAHCVETGDWPAYPTGVHRIAPPRWLNATTPEETPA